MQQSALLLIIIDVTIKNIELRKGHQKGIVFIFFTFDRNFPFEFFTGDSFVLLPIISGS